MTPAPRALWGALVGALAVGLLLGWAPAGAVEPGQRPVAARADGDQVVFTGTFVRRPQIEVEDAAPVRRYQVAVDAVYGPGSVTTQRVTVRSRVALETCGLAGVGQGQAQQGQGGGTTPAPTAPTTAPTTAPSSAPTTTPPVPSTIDKQLRLFDTTVVGGEYVVNCSTVTLVDAAVLADLAAELGEGRPPGREVEPPTPVEDVEFECPDTGAAVDLGDTGDTGSCSALEETQSLDRAAAPGLALVIVGVLGLLVVRRMGRRA